MTSTRPTTTHPPTRRVDSPYRPVEQPADASGSDARPTWVSVSTLCAELDVSRSTWSKWRSRGVGPHATRLPNGQLRMRRDWIDDWLHTLDTPAPVPDDGLALVAGRRAQAGRRRA